MITMNTFPAPFGADHVKITLSAPKGAVTLSISDNGTGANRLNSKSEPVAGIGLRNMQERLEHHEGELLISSSAEGTTIRARLPKKLLRSEAVAAE